MKLIERFFIFAVFAFCASIGWAQSHEKAIKEAIAASAQSSGKLRTTLPSLHEWLTDLEKAGIVDRSMPREFRVAFPIAQFGNAGPTLKATYSSMPGNSDAKGPVLFINIPLR